MKLFADRPKRGKHYEDRLHHIMGVCHAMGILWQEARTEYHGKVETFRQELVRPSGQVLLTPTLEKYGLTVNPKVLQRIRAMAPQFCYALNVSSVRVEVDGDIVYICVPRDRQESDGVVSFESAWSIAPDLNGALLCGLTDDGSQAVLDLRDPAHAHCVAIGMTGSGKTTLLQTMLLSAEMQGLRVAILDPLGARGGLYALSGHPTVWYGGLFSDPKDIECALAILAHGDHSDTLRFVDAEGTETQHRDDSDLFAFVDETPSLCRECPGIAMHLTTLAQVGRHSGVHLVLGSQSATGLPMLQNVSARLVGRVADKQASYFATGRPDANAESLRGKGDFIFCCGDSLGHIQAALPGKDLLEQWQRRYSPRSPRALPARSPTPSLPAPVVAMRTGIPDAAMGRMLDGIPRKVVREIRAYYGDHKRTWPSLTWLEQHYGYRRGKARRAINCTALDLGLALPYPDWEQEYSDQTAKTLEVGHASR